MVFAMDGSTESLYVAGVTEQYAGLGLAKIDTQTLTLTPIGDFSGALKALSPTGNQSKWWEKQ